MERLRTWVGGVGTRARAAMASPRAPLAVAIGIGIVALVPRWQFAIEEHPPRLYLVGDMALYLDRGVALVERARTAWDTFTPIGYPALLAILRAAAPGELDRVGACQSVLGALTAAFTALFTYRLDRSLAASALAGLATALYFPLIFYTGFVLTETMFACLLAVYAWMVLCAAERRSAWLALGAGATLGLAVLVRPSLLAFLPYLALRAVRSGGDARRAARVTLLACGIVLAPVSIHNSVLLGRPALVATNGGVNFFLAHSECRSVRSTSGGAIVEVSTHFNRTHFDRRCERPEPFLDEAAYYEAALAELARHPGRLLRAWEGVAEGLGLAPRRSFPYQPFWPGSMQHDDLLDASSRLFAPLVLLPAVVHAIARARRPRGGAGDGGPGTEARSLAWAVLASVAVVLCAYNGNPRVRVSSDPLALALAASAWIAGARWLRERLGGVPLVQVFHRR